MKKSAILLTAFSILTALTALADDQPRGSLLEVHSCELYAGGCTVSSEATLDGRYMLRAWKFTGGAFAGVNLAGLQVALLQTSSDNLAAETVSADRAVIYLPKNANSSQRDALSAWLKSSLPDLKAAKLQSRVAPLQFTKSASGYNFTAGKSISVDTASLESCQMGGCGEALWYSPRSTAGVFTVAVNRSSCVAEPLLKLKWNESGRRSVFLARFGDPSPVKNSFITAADLCGPADRLF